MMTRDQLIQRWQSLAIREKSLLAMSAALLLCIFIFLALEPVMLRRQRLAGDIPRLRDDLAWMQSQLAELERLQGTNGTSSRADAPLSVALVEQLLQQVDIYDQVSDLRPVQGQSVSIRFENVVYARLIEFLAALRTHAAARVSLASIRRIEPAGHVEASLTLSPDAGS